MQRNEHIAIRIVGRHDGDGLIGVGAISDLDAMHVAAAAQYLVMVLGADRGERFLGRILVGRHENP